MKKVLFPILALILALCLGIVCADDPGSPLHASTPSSEDVFIAAAALSSTGLIEQLEDPDTIPCENLTDFEDIKDVPALGKNYDIELVSGGLILAERFSGQKLSYFGDFDVLSGTPSNPLTLQLGDDRRTLCILFDSITHSNVVAGLGLRGHSNIRAIGEGSIAVLFPSPQSQFKFDIIGVDGGGFATLNFFRADGSLIGTIVITPTDQTYGFRHANGTRDIAGFSIHNSDPGGISYDNICVASNALPVADAGSNQTVEQDSLGGASVTLNGSGSSDPDGDLLTYSWTWTGGAATGVNTTVLLPLGTTEITLTVDDGQGTGTDTVEITVEDTTPPSVDVGPDIAVEQETADGTEVTLSATVSDICDASPTITWSQGPTAVFPLGNTTVTVTATDASGNRATDTVVVTVEDTRPPGVDAGPDITVEQETADGTEVTLNATVNDICDTSPTITWSHGPTAVFPLGNTMVPVTATDASGNSATDTVIVTVVDTTPPEISVSVSPDTLWPPNHKMVDISATVLVYDICDTDPEVVLTGITSDEPDDAIGNGDGKTVNDIQADIGTTDYEFKLRAERVGEGDGRVYTITYTATDASGNSAIASATVVVP